MGAARELLAGAAWIYGAQVVTVLAQFAYAAVTSRIVGPSTFGAYAIALSVSGLVTLFVSGGMAQAVARMERLEAKSLRGLVTFAIVLGAGGAAFIWLTAPLWAAIWGDLAARPVIEFLALGPLVAPLIAISTTVMRRQGSFRLLAVVTLISNVLGMIIGVVMVLQLQSAMALAVSAIASQVALLCTSLLFSKRILWGLGGIGAARREVVFSTNLTAIKLAEYLIGNIMKFSVSRWLGSSYFGHWNRADMLATLPFQQIQNALLQAISPEFRHDIDKPHRAHRVWVDLLTLVAWFALPTSAVAAVVLPSLVSLLFGPGWEIAAGLATPLAISAGLQTISMVLSSAVESLGRFRWMWLTSLALIAIQLGGAAALFLNRDISVAMSILILTQILRHALQVGQCHKNGYINLGKLLLSYLVVIIFSSFFAGLAAVVMWLTMSAQAQSGFYVFAAMTVIGTVVALWKLRHRMPPYVLALKYGLIRRRH